MSARVFAHPAITFADLATICSAFSLQLRAHQGARTARQQRRVLIELEPLGSRGTPLRRAS